jgi:hypothetical protein
VRREHSRPLVGELQMWLREQRTKVSKHNDTGKAIDYLLKRWDAFTRFLDDGRLYLSSCAPSPSAARTGPSPAPTKVAAAPPRSTR